MMGMSARMPHDDARATLSTPHPGGWAMLADFSGLLLKASLAGVAVSLVAGGGVVLLALAV
jgi:hypothetical protein